ncbi:hypothetical protein CAOG_04907 [Capsaspora owczarzaki ATCC 30864]|uniref:Uncharacterized protein n=1 Tax=Capsaspora owczarzaki (strain ATCC 30864) TaxID=595528 RepID=A0A0D2X3F8_CAPO3|nr:hypothetical protein CAOG_04907 [Capsaspora owczarzaki ATCC 30864]KJE94234.1 hypothetical protein CAOG_004907 [Capsaspora owczarzaki ATCC 30864]|eukprot:XP_004347658.1 hypothetical protein CAOG_04907 [Capsaspora owczarzaki ATCC 30864]
MSRGVVAVAVLLAALVAAISLPMGVRSADSSSSSNGVADRVAHLDKLQARSSSGLIKLDIAKYTSLMRTAPRNYSVILMLTSLNPRQNCKPCSFGHAEFEVLASSWLQSPEYQSGQLYFAVAEFESASEVFEKLKTQSIPTIMHFPAIGGPKPSDTYRMQQLGLEAENVLRFVAERTGISFQIKRPVDYMFYVLLTLGLVVGAAVLYKLLPAAVQFYRNPTYWAFAAVTVCFLFTSGQMWNQIRGPPYIAGNPNGPPMFFHPSSQSQFGVESHIVMALYATIAGSFLLLNISAPFASTPILRRSAVYTFLAVFVFFLSVAFSIFRQKQRGYPFRLFF